MTDLIGPGHAVAMVVASACPVAQRLSGGVAARRRGGGRDLGRLRVPVSLAYASLAGLLLQVGIYGYLLGGLGYALLGFVGSSPSGPTSAISLMVAASVAPMAEGDAERHAQIASLAAFTVAWASLARIWLFWSAARHADQCDIRARLQDRRRGSPLP